MGKTMFIPKYTCEGLGPDTVGLADIAPPLPPSLGKVRTAWYKLAGALVDGALQVEDKWTRRRYLKALERSAGGGNRHRPTSAWPGELIRVVADGAGQVVMAASASRHGFEQASTGLVSPAEVAAMRDKIAAARENTARLLGETEGPIPHETFVAAVNAGRDLAGLTRKEDPTFAREVYPGIIDQYRAG